MNDCPNADVRDLLPDLLHGHLDQATRAMVASHVAGCAACRAEWALLGDLRASMAGTPALNLAAIAAAVPAYRATVRRSWVGWRTAAAVTLVVVGASSIIVTQRIGTRPPDSLLAAAERPAAAPLMDPEDSGVHGSVPVAPAPPESDVPSAGHSSVVPVRPTPAPAVRELAMGGGSLTDLSDRELASLLKEIESLDAVPSTDVESVPIAPIAPRKGGP